MIDVYNANPYDPRYVEARRVLLDALTALQPHARAVIVAGAQAVYLRTGDADIAVAPYTTDGDLALDPSFLSDDPELEAVMSSAGLVLLQNSTGHAEPGTWVATVQINQQEVIVPVDLIVPQALASGGTRGARLGPHGRRAARLVPGIEAILVDHSPMMIGALDPSDSRSLVVEVAGVAALLIAKAHNIHDRDASGKAHRRDDKDSADVVRIMQTTSPTDVGTTVAELLTHPVAGASAEQGVDYLGELFGRRGRPGIVMATRALELGLPAAAVEMLCVSYMERLLAVCRADANSP